MEVDIIIYIVNFDEITFSLIVAMLFYFWSC